MTEREASRRTRAILKLIVAPHARAIEVVYFR